MPLISIIVPVYKVKPYLERCIDSILAQTFTDYELILVDDGSPDNCGVICDEYAARDSRIRVIHQKNEGLSAARNAGIDWAFANSNSEWLTFVDSDDWIHPQMIEMLYRAVQMYGMKVSICGYRETHGDNPWDDIWFKDAVVWPVEQYYVEHNVNATVAWGKLYHKDCFKDIRYPVGKIYEDEYVKYQILFALEKVAVVDVPMYAYFVNPQGITKSKWTTKKLVALEAYKEQLRFFSERGYAKAYRAQAVRYIRKLCLSIDEIQKNHEIDGRRKMLFDLRIELIHGLIRHRKDGIFEQKNLWIYESTFSWIVKAYWTYVGIKGKMKKFMQL